MGEGWRTYLVADDDVRDVFGAVSLQECESRVAVIAVLRLVFLPKLRVILRTARRRTPTLTEQVAERKLGGEDTDALPRATLRSRPSRVMPSRTMDS
jgi:hypothetical protein